RSDEQGGVSPGARNRAWLQLARQLYTSGSRVEARNALEQVDPLLLHQQDPALYYEWHYLSGQIAITDGIGDLGRSLQALEQQSNWWAYLQFNQALKSSRKGEPALAEQAVQQL